MWVAGIGAFTAILAATIALVQNDIKRVLAYSTVSQLGYMFLALGVGAYWVAIFHLFTHAFFKALLFLGSGSVIHAMSGEQDMRYMGGLRKKIPVTHWTMWVGSVAIAGIPGLAGFFSKDEILWQAFSSPQRFHGCCGWWAWLTAAMTAFYMWRLMNMTFYGQSRVKPEIAAHVHESPAAMTVPLMRWPSAAYWPVGWERPSCGTWARASAASRAGWRRSSRSAAVEAAKEGAHDASVEWILMGLSVAVAIIGIVIARYFYHHKPEIPDTLEKASSRSIRCSTTNGTWTRSTIFSSSTAWAKAAGARMGAFDREVVDGGVNGAGWLTRFSSKVSMWWDTWIVDGAVRFTSFFVKLLSYPACLLESGRVQTYAFFVVVGVLAFFGYYVAR